MPYGDSWLRSESYLIKALFSFKSISVTILHRLNSFNLGSMRWQCEYDTEKKEKNVIAKYASYKSLKTDFHNFWSALDLKSQWLLIWHSPLGTQQRFQGLHRRVNLKGIGMRDHRRAYNVLWTMWFFNPDFFPIFVSLGVNNDQASGLSPAVIIPGMFTLRKKRLQKTWSHPEYICWKPN